MALTSRGPGAVLGERYRLDDLLEEFEGGRFWRATDMVLAADELSRQAESLQVTAQRFLSHVRAEKHELRAD